MGRDNDKKKDEDNNNGSLQYKHLFTILIAFKRDRIIAAAGKWMATQYPFYT